MDGQNTYYLSETDIANAPMLAETHQQRLQDIPYTQNTNISFHVNSIGHFARVEICVSQVPCEGSQNSFYQPYARYYPCCNAFEENQALSLIQLVYDVYIRPIRWKFNIDWYGAFYSSGRLLHTNRDSCQKCPPENASRCEYFNAPTAGTTAAAHSQQLPPPPLLTGKRINERSEDGALIGTGRPVENIDTTIRNRAAKRRKRERPSKEILTEKLVATVKQGQKKLKEYTKDDLCRYDTQSVIELCLQNPGNHANLSKEFDKLEKALVQRLAKSQADNTIGQWLSWLHVECFKRIHELWRKGALGQSDSGVPVPDWKSGAKIVNGVVNRLVATEGPRATNVYCAIASKSEMPASFDRSS